MPDPITQPVRRAALERDGNLGILARDLFEPPPSSIEQIAALRARVEAFEGWARARGWRPDGEPPSMLVVPTQEDVLQYGRHGHAAGRADRATDRPFPAQAIFAEWRRKDSSARR